MCQRSSSWWCSAAAGLVVSFLSSAAGATVLSVPGDYPTIQGALDAAAPGDRIEVAAGVYRETLVVPRSGAPDQPITLAAAAGARPVLDGRDAPGRSLILIDSKSHVAVEGLEIRNLRNADDASGIRILGSGRDLRIQDNVIHDLRGISAMAITVYGTEESPLEDVVIRDNLIHDCEPAPSETVTLNGNVRSFAIEGNTLRDNNNIGIDMIGGEREIQPNQSLVARDGVVRGNVVLRSNANYEGGYAAGIYVDGGRDIVIERNLVRESDLGIEVAAENAGVVTSGVVVRDNVLTANERAGLVFGGNDANRTGRANDNLFRNNTLYRNNTVGESGRGRYFSGGGLAEVFVNYSEGNVFENNIVCADQANILLYAQTAEASRDNRFDYNLYCSAAALEGAELQIDGRSFYGVDAWRSGSGQDPSSIGADPGFVAPEAGDFRVASGSPAIDAGSPATALADGELDYSGRARRIGSRVDIGAVEHATATPCVEDATTRCLAAGRFAVRVTWRDFEGHTGSGQATPEGSADSALFWFFEPTNWELLVKVLDGCAINGHYWVLAAATTDVEYRIAVTDSVTGTVWSTRNELGRAPESVIDTSALEVCTP